MLVLAFFAGFTERMVKKLAERIQFRDIADDLATSPPAGGGLTGRAPAPGDGDGSASAAIPPGAAADGEEEEDGCLAHHEVTDDEATDDTQLPPATGGIEAAASPAP
jgi:hypothetical protein